MLHEIKSTNMKKENLLILGLLVPSFAFDIMLITSGLMSLLKVVLFLVIATITGLGIISLPSNEDTKN